jgi:hypothetical protein
MPMLDGETVPSPNGDANGDPIGNPNGAIPGDESGFANGVAKGEANGDPKGDANGAEKGEANGVANGWPIGVPMEGTPKGEAERCISFARMAGARCGAAWAIPILSAERRWSTSFKIATVSSIIRLTFASEP